MEPGGGRARTLSSIKPERLPAVVSVVSYGGRGGRCLTMKLEHLSHVVMSYVYVALSYQASSSSFSLTL